MRGIGNLDFSLAADPGMGICVDGLYMSRSAGGALDVLDVERIERRRGPQGALFGRNAMGGTVNCPVHCRRHQALMQWRPSLRTPTGRLASSSMSITRIAGMQPLKRVPWSLGEEGFAPEAA